MKTEEIRASFLSFFESKGHQCVQSDSLIPQNDPTLLFTGAGMNQFKDYFLGLRKDLTRATSSQKCLRTGDLDNVGKTCYHHSFFEMLGNFSFGDYFKEEAISWAWEYLTKELKISPEKLRVSVHQDDDEAYKIWAKKIKIRPEWITKLDDETNFWPANAPTDGPNGPCGPCSEIYFDQGEDFGLDTKNDSITSESGRFAEIWNLVFTEFDREGKNKLIPLANKNIDTGMGLERLACVLQGKRSNFEIDIFEPALKTLKSYMPKARAKDLSHLYLITDHSRAAFFSIADGALPSNEGRGYVIRKLIRRALWHGWRLGKKDAFLYSLLPAFIETMGRQYPELGEHEASLKETVKGEEERFLTTLEAGLEILNEEIKLVQKKGEVKIHGEKAFKLYDTYGFPLELTREVSSASNLSINEKEFDQCMSEQRQKAKEGSQLAGSIFVKTDFDEKLAKLTPTVFKGYEAFKVSGKVLLAEKIDGKTMVILDKTPFYGESGGQVGDRGIIKNKNFSGEIVDTKRKHNIIIHMVANEKGSIAKGDSVEAEVNSGVRADTVRHHSATHLLQSALRSVLGEKVRQLGSLVNDEKLRFDFSFSRALTPSEIEKIEIKVNEMILENTSAKIEEVDIETAKKMGALAFFGEKYGKTVRVVALGPSTELCGGCHVRATGDIGFLKILSESAVASGVRRIEAVAGLKALDYVNSQIGLIQELSRDLKAKPEELFERIKKLQNRAKELEKGKGGHGSGEKFLEASWKIAGGDAHVVCEGYRGVPAKNLKSLSDPLRKNKKKTLAFLFSEDGERLSIVIGLTPDLVEKGMDAGNLTKLVAKLVNGTGGGKKDLAQGGGTIPNDFDEFIEKIKTIIQ